MQRLVSGLAGLLLLLAGCGGDGDGDADGPHKIDESAWRAEVESRAGHEIRDWPGYQALWTGMCEDDKDADSWALTVAVFTDDGASVSDMEMNLDFACPDQLDTFRDGVAQVQGTSAEMDRLCATDPNLLTEDERQMVEAVGC